MPPRARWVSFVVCILATCGFGCGKAVRPQNPRVPGANVQFVERDAPFIVDWEPQQIARLAAALRDQSSGTVVVAYRRNAIRLLPDCWVSGSYGRAATGLYTGMLQIRSSDVASVNVGVPAGALWQISTSAGIGHATLLNYRFVLVGRYDVGGSRRSASLLELQDRAPYACQGATHFVRAASTGAFERLSDAYGAAGMQASAPGVGAGVSGQSQQTIGASGGNYGRCAAVGNLNDAACAALLKIELSPLQPAMIPLRLSAFSVAGQLAPNLHFRFRGRKSYLVETPSFMTSSAVVNHVLAPAEITEDAPLLVDVVQTTSQGPAIIGSGQIAPADLRRGITSGGTFVIELRSPGIGPMGTAQMAFVR